MTYNSFAAGGTETFQVSERVKKKKISWKTGVLSLVTRVRGLTHAGALVHRGAGGIGGGAQRLSLFVSLLRKILKIVKGLFFSGLPYFRFEMSCLTCGLS